MKFIIIKLIAVVMALASESQCLPALPKFSPRPPADIGRNELPETSANRCDLATNDVETDFRISSGFLFVHGQYYRPSTALAWHDNTLQIESAPSTLLAYASPILESEGKAVPSPLAISQTKALTMTRGDFQAMRALLEDDGVVILSRDFGSMLLDHSRGGFELIQSLTLPPGPRREQLLNTAFVSANINPEMDARSWLSEFVPSTELTARAVNHVEKVLRTESVNLAAVAAVRRFENLSYPITLVAMAVFVFSIGSLIAVRPQELVAVAGTKEETSVKKFLSLIAVMSIIDLVWTLLAHQANRITEVNPVGGVMLDEPSRVILFKLLATSLAIGILYRTRTSPLARQACWWVCLSLALLMARWILVAGISA